MKRLLLILLCFPMIGFGQTSFDINDYKLLNIHSSKLPSILKESQESGYEILRDEDNDNSMILHQNP